MGHSLHFRKLRVMRHRKKCISVEEASITVTGGENTRKKETRQPSNVAKVGAASRIKRRLLGLERWFSH